MIRPPSLPAIYKMAPASRLASKLLGQWNTYEIRAIGDSISVTLNGTPVSQLKNGNRPERGFVGLQNHHPGSRGAVPQHPGENAIKTQG
jgi:hypothetical protein